MEITHTIEKRRKNNVYPQSHVMKHEPDRRQTTRGLAGGHINNFIDLFIVKILYIEYIICIYSIYLKYINI